MGKQSNKPTLVSQEQYNRDLDKSLEILHNDGASDQELIDYTNDYKSRFTVEKTKDTKPTTQKKNPNANKNGVSNSGTGSSGFPKVDTDPYNVFPDTDTKTTQVKEKPQQKMATLNSYSFKQAMSKEKSVLNDL